MKSAYWRDAQLVVIDNIPAFVCQGCGERIFDDATSAALDLMRGDGVPADEPANEAHVTIVSFSRRVPAELDEIAQERE